MRHPKPEESESAASVAAANTAGPRNSVGVGYTHSSLISNHEKNVQAQIDVVHKLAFLGLKLILIVYPRH
ncbi:unnamed protein product, partial [Hymenolepis diminuta]